MPAPSKYYLAEAEGVGPHGRIIGAVRWVSQSTGKPQYGGGNQQRRADALYERSIRDGFRCLNCGVDLDKGRRADTTCCTIQCRWMLYYCRKKGDPTVPPARPYRRKNQEEHDKQMLLRRQMGLVPWDKKFRAPRRGEETEDHAVDPEGDHAVVPEEDQGQ